MKNRTFKKLFIVVSAVLILILLSSCIYDPSLPVYKKTDEDGISVYIDGVRYKQLPKLKWYVNPTFGKEVGYAGSKDVRVSLPYSYTGKDSDTDFVFLQYSNTDYYSEMLYRTDKDIPDVSVDSVDKIMWEEYNFNNYQKDNYYSNTTADKEVIKALFELLDKGERTNDIHQIVANNDVLLTNIWLYCSDIPDATYQLNVGSLNGKIVFGNYDAKFVYMPDYLVEKVVGKKIDVSKLTE